MRQPLLASEDLAIPAVRHLVIEDDTPLPKLLKTSDPLSLGDKQHFYQH